MGWTRVTAVSPARTAISNAPSSSAETSRSSSRVATLTPSTVASMRASVMASDATGDSAPPPLDSGSVYVRLASLPCSTTARTRGPTISTSPASRRPPSSENGRGRTATRSTERNGEPPSEASTTTFSSAITTGQACTTTS